LLYNNLLCKITLDNLRGYFIFMPRTAKPKRKLTSRQIALIEQLADPKLKSNTQAAIAAGYSPKIARQQVCDSLALPHITQAVQKRIARARAFYHVEPEEIIGSTVFQMRSSMDDVLDESGSFSITKARETGAIDLLKKHKEIIREVTAADGSIERIKTVEVELLTNQDARRDLANYFGVERFADSAVGYLPRFNQICASISDAAAFLTIREGQEVTEQATAKLFLSDHRSADLPFELINLIAKKYDLPEFLIEV